MFKANVSETGCVAVYTTCLFSDDISSDSVPLLGLMRLEIIFNVLMFISTLVDVL
jgi:hypothetical protein